MLPLTVKSVDDILLNKLDYSGVAWAGVLDSHFLIEVHREPFSAGTLHIFEVVGDKIIHVQSKGVSIQNGSFIPSAEDIASWQQFAVNFADMVMG